MELYQLNPNTRSARLDEFEFTIEYDRDADPIAGVGVWVFFKGEPCCDESGHQFRFFLPLGVKERTVLDVCRAFILATHCDTFHFAA